MLIQVGDWVQTENQQVGKVSSIDEAAGKATITRVDPEQLRLVAETYSINELRKCEIQQ
jgi:hypothetical protein